MVSWLLGESVGPLAPAHAVSGSKLCIYSSQQAWDKMPEPCRGGDDRGWWGGGAHDEAAMTQRRGEEERGPLCHALQAHVLGGTLTVAVGGVLVAALLVFTVALLVRGRGAPLAMRMET